jgi:hypothetical protein
MAWSRRGYNTYGHHPIYLGREKSNKFYLIYFRNSNAMDISINTTSAKDILQNKGKPQNSTKEEANTGK